MSDSIFERGSIIGMVHVAALPGTPRHKLLVDRIVEEAVEEARLLAAAGFDGVLIENMHDVPYLRRDVGPEVVACMTRIATEVRTAVKVRVGIQILAGANAASLAVAHATGLDFIRAEGFVFASIADEGLIADADAGPLLRYRRAIGADQVKVFADIKKKHSAHAITADVSIAETASGAEFFGADGVVVTGASTSDPADLDDLRRVRGSVDIPVFVGSGATPEQLPALFAQAEVVIVGSWIKRNGHWAEPIDPVRAAEFRRAAIRAVA